jgi:hypothetical protein
VTTATGNWINGFSKETFTGGAVVTGTFDTVDTVIGITSTKTFPGGATDYTTIDYGVMRNSNGAWYYKNPGTALIASLGAGFTAETRWAFLYDSVAGKVYAIADGVVVQTWVGVAANLKMQAAFSTYQVVGRKVGNLSIAPVVGQVGATLGSRFNLNAYRNDGTTLVTDALAVTALGTAAAISGQGTLATRGDVYFGSAFVLESSGGAQATLPNFKTGLGTAAAISGQGALATLSAANWSTQVTGTGKPDDYATFGDNILQNAGLVASSALWALGGGMTRTAPTVNDPGYYFHSVANAEIASANNGAMIPVTGGSILYPSLWMRTNNTANWIYFSILGYNKDTGLVLNYSNQTFAGVAATWAYRRCAAVAVPASCTQMIVSLQVVDGAGGGGFYMDFAHPRLAPTQAAATLGATASTNLFRSDGSTVMTQGEVRTAEGTAAAITSQGALATRGDVYFGSAYVLESSGGAQATLGNFKTGLGTAAAISGQGALATLSAVSLDSQVNDGTTYKKVAAGEITTGGALRLSTAGSGKKLGDARNLPNIVSANLAYKFTGAITYTSAAGTPATATISVAAGSVVYGSASTSYNAMSVGTSGTGGTTVTYFLYVDDPTNAGGTQTLVATTTALTVYQSDGRVFIGTVDVFYPAAGTGGGSGGGGGGWCVDADSFLAGLEEAHAAAAGDLVGALDYDTMESETQATITGVEFSWEPCIELVSASGVRLVASTSTTMTFRDGSLGVGVEAQGRQLFVRDDDQLGWQTIAETNFVGLRRVAHVHAGGATFGAGVERGRYIYTHNPDKP